MRIVEAKQSDIQSVRQLFSEYQQWLGIDLCFQGFEEEMATLPGRYASPHGVILLAIEDGKAVGCVGVRLRVENEAELKRLYVQANHQGKRFGKQLFNTAMLKARSMGYASIVLDTLPTMLAAKSLYISYGFKQISAYYANPEQGAEYYRYAFS